MQGYGTHRERTDINESRYKFSVSKDGSVRFGLAAVKGVGLNAVNAIVSEREASGPYKDIYDFVERVNLSACKPFRHRIACPVEVLLTVSG